MSISNWRSNTRRVWSQMTCPTAWQSLSLSKIAPAAEVRSASVSSRELRLMAIRCCAGQSVTCLRLKLLAVIRQKTSFPWRRRHASPGFLW